MNIEPNIVTAIIALGFDGGFKIKDKKIAVWYREDTQPTEAAIQTELDKQTLEWAGQEYARNRASGYPSIGDQLDMQYWDQVNNTTTWKDAVAKVKSDNPKSTE